MPDTIPIALILEYLKACSPVTSRVSGQIRLDDPLSKAVVPLVAAVTVLEQSVRTYRRSGHWDGVPTFLAAMAAEPIPAVQSIDSDHAMELTPWWISKLLQVTQDKDSSMGFNRAKKPSPVGFTGKGRGLESTPQALCATWLTVLDRQVGCTGRMCFVNGMWSGSDGAQGQKRIAIA